MFIVNRKYRLAATAKPLEEKISEAKDVYKRIGYLLGPEPSDAAWREEIECLHLSAIRSQNYTLDLFLGCTPNPTDKDKWDYFTFLTKGASDIARKYSKTIVVTENELERLKALEGLEIEENDYGIIVPKGTEVIPSKLTSDGTGTLCWQYFN